MEYNSDQSRMSDFTLISIDYESAELQVKTINFEDSEVDSLSIKQEMHGESVLNPVGDVLGLD